MVSKGAAILVLLLSLPWAHAEEAVPLPEPLTLESALDYATTLRGAVAWQQQSEVARLEQRRAELEQRQAPQLDLEGRLRWRGVTDEGLDPRFDDHRLALLYRQQLTDFGRTDLSWQALDLSEQEVQLQERQRTYQQRLEVMQRFFAVLLADLHNNYLDERLSIAFIRFDRQRERQLLGQSSELEGLRLESAYQQILLEKRQAQNDQRYQRSLLATVLGHTGQLPSELLMPSLTYPPEQPLPPFDKVNQLLQQHNLQLAVVEQQLAVLQRQQLALDRGFGATLHGEAEVADGPAEAEDGANRWRIGLKLTLPLSDRGQRNAELAVVAAQRAERQSEQQQLRDRLYNRALELWLQLSELSQQLQASRVHTLYREYYLDNSRANYEMEFQADLGDAMIEMSVAQKRYLQTQMALMLAHEELDALLNGHWRPLLAGSANGNH